MMCTLPDRLFLLVLVVLGSASSACHEELAIATPKAERVEVESLTLRGVQAVEESRLRAALATKESSFLPWKDPHYFNRAEFERDLERIDAFYEDRGYPDAQVVSSNVTRTENGHAVRVEIVIDEGQPMLVRDITLDGFDVLSAEERERMRAELPLQPGEPLALEQAVASRELAARVLGNHGYPYAEVTTDREDRDGDVAVVLRAHPGPVAFFGPIAIAGNSSVSDNVIRRELAYRPGELFRRDRIRESLQDLYRLELFQFANIELASNGSNSAEAQAAGGHVVPTRVTVAEGDHRRFEFSFGYGTEEKARAEAEWRHVNFYGGARTLRLHGKWSWLDRGVEGTFVQPFLFGPKLSFSAQGVAWFADELAYDALTRGGRATVTRQIGQDSTVSGALTYQFQRSQISNDALLDPTLRDELIALGLDPTTGVQDGALLAVGSDLRWQRVDDVVSPSRGYITSLSLEQAGGWLPGSYNYFSAIGEVRGYYTPHTRITLAARARYGAIDPFTVPSDVPFFKRFFLGGATSLRGWGRYEVSPLSGSGLPIGGNSLFESSVELRTQVWGSVGLVAFVDAGNVWADAWSGQFDNLLVDAGPGLRYDTPIGPLRLDFAYQLKQLEGLRINGELQERPWRLHFSIGHAF